MSNTWTLLECLRWTESYFDQKSIDSPRLTAELLLAHVLHCERITLYIDYDRPLSELERAQYKGLIIRRLSGEPVAYILGEAAFMTLTLHVTPAVLIPRPETEQLVDLVVSHFRSRLSIDSTALPVFVDLGTGSCCIAIALSKFLPSARVLAADISASALDIAQKNVARHAVDISLFEGNWLTPLRYNSILSDTSVFIVSNPPYVTEAEWPLLEREVRDFEPRSALVSADEGLLSYREILTQSHDVALSGLAFEVGHAQADAVSSLISQHYPDFSISIHPDLSGTPRLVFACRV